MLQAEEQLKKSLLQTIKGNKKSSLRWEEIEWNCKKL